MKSLSKGPRITGGQGRTFHIKILDLSLQSYKFVYKEPDLYKWF